MAAKKIPENHIFKNKDEIVEKNEKKTIFCKIKIIAKLFSVDYNNLTWDVGLKPVNFEPTVWLKGFLYL